MFSRLTLPITLIALMWAPGVHAAKLTVLLDWFVNPDHATLIVAQEKGYFRDAGLEVEMIAPANPNDPPKLVAAKQADIAISHQPQLQMQVAEGLPLDPAPVQIGPVRALQIHEPKALSNRDDGAVFP